MIDLLAGSDLSAAALSSEIIENRCTVFLVVVVCHIIILSFLLINDPSDISCRTIAFVYQVFC